MDRTTLHQRLQAVEALLQRSWFMVDQSERSARLLVWALHAAPDGKPRWWMLPTKLNEVTKEAIALAVARGWMLDRGDSVCLTDAGRDLVRKSTNART